MNLSALDWMLWVGILVGEVALFSILIICRRWKEFPIFTTLTGFDTVVSILLMGIYLHHSPIWYARVYWTDDFVDFALQLGVIWEIASIVMRPTGSWVRDARKQFILWGAAGILLAAALPWLVTPPAASLLERLEVRGNLFTSLVTCELIAVVTRTSKSLGLGWRNHVMALGNGLTAWAVSAILVDGLHGYLGTKYDFTALEHARMFVYLAALGYWAVQFWLEEPARQPLSPELRAYIEALHERIKNNLDTLEDQRYDA
jgi:hypothetical protein